MACQDACEAPLPSERPRLWRSGPVRASVLGWTFALAGLALEGAGVARPLASVAYAVAIVCAGFYFAREAVAEVREEREVGIELLMTVAIVGAAGLGRWREAALVACLYSITEALEGFTIQRTRYAIRSLMDLVPPTVHRVAGGLETDIPVQDVQVGDRIRVRPGENVPVDGLVREGASAVDESPITGESMPVERAAGDKVVAGTINGNGALLVEATTRYEDNTVARIIHLVERAQAQKGRTQLFVERFGRVYSPAVLAGSAVLALVMGLAGSGWIAAAVRAVSFLVAASPCALAVATPVTLVAAIGSLARRGVLVKGGVALEAIAAARAVAFDKTGTLTHGRPVLTGVRPIGSYDANEVVALAAAVERHSEHPLGDAIVRGAEERQVRPMAARDVRALPGNGVVGMVENEEVAVLKPAAAAERGVVLAAADASWRESAQARGETVVVVARSGRTCGLLALADTVRAEAAAIVAQLRDAGMAHVVMLTGDNPATAQAIARKVGIDEFHAGLMPEDKVTRVEALRARYRGIVMVGDGINDAPALAAASVGIAMGTRGSDAALAAADVALIGDDLAKIADVIRGGRRASRLIKQNIAVSIAIVVVLVAGTLAGRLGMLGAVVGHEGTEVLIILNGLRAALR